MRPAGLLCVTLLLVARALAQVSHGYVAAGLGTNEARLISQGAIGADIIVKGGLGLGGEAAFVAGHRTYGLLSGAASYHFAWRNAALKFDPFVTAGGGLAGSIFFAGPAVNFGGGVNYWFSERFGLRLELRDTVVHDNRAQNFWAFRVGLAFH